MKLTGTQRIMYDLIMQNNGISYEQLGYAMYGDYNQYRYRTLKVLMCNMKKELAKLNLHFPADHSKRPVIFYPVEVIDV